MTSDPQWRRIDAALDEILALPAADWDAACARLAGDDAAFRRELESLLAHVEGEDPLLDFPAGTLPSSAAPPPAGLTPGVRIGAYRVVELIGRGGMGDVYRAERADGHFEQQVAIKLMRRELDDRQQRFHAERQILARLEHPNIAGLHDGGVAEDGRLYMVMDLVVGRHITRWCADRRSTLAERLTLFLAVCDAVAYAHRKLIVHRDLKPSNVLVTEEGVAKLLDFGVARLLDQAPNTETRHGALTPGYAAPEQLNGGQITTATDVYALGMLLFELLTGANPWGADELPLAALVGRVLQQDVPPASRFAAGQRDPPVAPKSIAGDLDAIVAKALRKEPESRYASVTLLQADVVRMLRSEPVTAREGARAYVAGRFLKRHRWGVAAATVIAAAVLTAAGGIAWQGHLAKREAARALAVKNFLIAVFRASDPRIAADKPRGQLTAKELLDGSVDRIERDFAGQPDLQLELLGIADEIYGYLLDDDRYDALMKQRIALARRVYGDHHPVVIEGAITDAWADIFNQNFTEAGHELQRADVLLKEAGLDASALRAEWWLAQGRALESTADSDAARRHAVDEAIRLFAAVDPVNKGYPAALANAATTRYLDAEYDAARALNARAIEVARGIPDHDDTDLALIYGNQGDVLAKLGRFAEAEASYDTAADLVRRTSGEQYGTYWRVQGLHAAMLYRHGDRERALSMLAAMLATIPPDWKATTDDTQARALYADCLTQEGRSDEALPLLQTARSVFASRPRHDYDLRNLELALGDAYEDAGQVEAARTALRWAVDDYAAHVPPGHPAALEARERWARFLIEHPGGAADEAAARDALGRLLDSAAPVAPYTTAAARAHQDLARLALRAGRPDQAARESAAAAAALREVRSVHDVRIDDDLLLLQGEVLAAEQRLPEARTAAAAALTAARRHDGASSAALRRARSLADRLGAAPAS